MENKKIILVYVICLFFTFVTRAFSSAYGTSFYFRIKCESPSKIAEKQIIFNVTIPDIKIAITSHDYIWSNWAQITSKDIDEIKKQYPNLYLNRYPLVISVSITSIAPSLSGTKVFVEYKVSDNTYSSKALLFGKGPLSLGILQWMDSSGKVKIGTEAQYNKSHYWKYIQKFASKIHPEGLKKLILADRFIGGDSDYYDWEEGFDNLSLVGFNTLEVPPGYELREILTKSPIKKIGWAVYCPPGYVFDFDKKATSNTALKKWADSIAKPYINSGYKKTDFALFNLSDEPGWYYPSAFKSVIDNSSNLNRFHKYLREKKFRPEDFGLKKWSEVIPLGRSVADGPLSKRKLYYWTCRFFPHVSDKYFARVTKILEGTFYYGMPITVNWNFFSGRYFVPGPVANNPDKQNPDAAMGGHDWLKFGESKGSTCLWTEDWFGDNQSYQWSYYASKLNSAARKNNLEFGGYVVGRAAGKGIEQKILALFGHGAKAVYTYVFGPEYNFPGNCWSENINVAKGIMKTSTMLADAEGLLYPGRLPIPKVAILTPESSQVWDLKSEKIANGISDATNTNLNNANVYYMAEVYDLFLGLMHANIPVDFVDEKDIKNISIMKNYSCLYITEPDIPFSCISPLKKWIKKGGILATTYGTGNADRYDTPYKFPYYFFSTFHQLYGAEVKEPAHPRIIINWNGWRTSAKAKISGKYGNFSCAWTKGKITITDKKNVKILAHFKNGGPAIIYRKFGKGGVIHYAFDPGLSYFYSQIISGKTGMLGLPDGFSTIIRDYILYPIKIARIKSFISVNKPMIEALPLVSKKGIAITLLNWSGIKQKNIEINVNLPGKFSRAKSVLLGKLQMAKTSKGISCEIPLNKADIILLYK